MAKRFIDTNIFSDDYFIDLPIESKLFFIYFFTNCDHAGVLKLNRKIASIQLGVQTPIDDLLLSIGACIVQINENTYWMPNYLKIQYNGFPQSQVKQQNSALKILNNLGLDIKQINSYLTVSKQLPNSYLTVTLGLASLATDKESLNPKLTVSKQLPNCYDNVYINNIDNNINNNTIDKPQGASAHVIKSNSTELIQKLKTINPHENYQNLFQWLNENYTQGFNVEIWMHELFYTAWELQVIKFCQTQDISQTNAKQAFFEFLKQNAYFERIGHVLNSFKNQIKTNKSQYVKQTSTLERFKTI